MLQIVLRTAGKTLGIALIAFLSLLGAVWGGNRLADAYTAAVSAPEAGSSVMAGIEIPITIEEGSSAGRIFDVLARAGIVDRGELETLVARRNLTSKLRAGTYTMRTGMSAADVVEVLLAGPVQAEYSVTLIEGLRTSEMLRSLSEQTPYTYEEYYNVLAAGGVTSAYLPERADLGEVEKHGHDIVEVQWEGLLAPDTYQFSTDAPAWRILQVLADTAADKIDSVEWKHLRAAGYSVYDGLIIASLIESEVRFDDERGTVSGVIYNRLEADMLLGIDATTLYAAQVRGRGPTAAELAEEDPYNTRVVRGLPPSPIAGVRLASLEAAAAPQEHEFLYYLVIDTEGHHGFTETLEEFNELKAASKAKGLF